jgi:hypothetical protein
MFARVVECIPRLENREEFLKKSRPSTSMQQIEAGNGTTHDEAMLKWARELALILFAVLIVLVISIAGK